MTRVLKQIRHLKGARVQAKNYNILIVNCNSLHYIRVGKHYRSERHRNMVEHIRALFAQVQDIKPEEEKLQSFATKIYNGAVHMFLEESAEELYFCNIPKDSGIALPPSLSTFNARTMAETYLADAETSLPKSQPCFRCAPWRTFNCCCAQHIFPDKNFGSCNPVDYTKMTGDARAAWLAGLNLITLRAIAACMEDRRLVESGEKLWTNWRHLFQSKKVTQS